MLLLVFHIGQARYGVAAENIARVLPLVHLEAPVVAHSAALGMMNYGGRPVSVVDFSSYVTGQPCRRGTSTRIVLVEVVDAQDETAPPRLAGLMVERAYDTQRFSADRSYPPDMALGLPTFVTAMVRGDGVMIRVINALAVVKEFGQLGAASQEVRASPCP